jgi:hypothetical protein
MPHTITLSDTSYTKLQALAQPFVDTPESVIARLADAELKRRATGQGADDANGPGIEHSVRLDPDRHESLTHAKLLAATVEGKELHRPKWNSLLDHMHVLARKRLGSFEALQKASSANVRPGRYEEDGFHYLPDADLSIQGVDSNLAWSHSLGLARHLRTSIRVRFEWRHKDGAARPGQVAVLEWLPPNLSVA